MRENTEYIIGMLDELEAIIEDASRVPMRRGLALIDRSDLLVMLDELKSSLPAELAEAEAIRRECGAIVVAAEEEAARIVEAAREQAEIRATETEVYRRSQRRAQEVIDRAGRYAQEVTGGSEVYRDRVMGQLEGWFEDSIISVGESRQELEGGSRVRRAAAPGDEEDGRRQVSSA